MCAAYRSRTVFSLIKEVKEDAPSFDMRNVTNYILRITFCDVLLDLVFDFAGATSRNVIEQYMDIVARPATLGRHFPGCNYLGVSVAPSGL